MTPERWQYLTGRLSEALESGDPVAFAGGDGELLELIQACRQSENWLAPPTADQWLGATLLGRYQLLGTLGRGGAGVVYVATDLQIPGRRIVVKLLHDFWGGQDWMRKKFRDEAAILAKLDHPGIISLLDAGETEDGRLFLLMPYHEGRTLRDAMAQPIDTLLAARWIREAGEAISHAHQHRILHRDLKPENVLLVKRNGAESPMLLDFGIAQFGDPVTASRTTTHLMGSAFYMAPEHLLGRPEPASDLYSLATIAWEMLTGRHPFEADSPFALPELQRNGVGDAFFRLRPDLGLAAGRLLSRALDVDPKRRPMPVEAFASELADDIAAQGVDLRLARLWAIRRTRRGVLAGGALTLAAAAGGGLLLRDLLNPLTAEERVIHYDGARSVEANGYRRMLDMYGEFLSEPGRPTGYRACRFFSKTQGVAAYPLTGRQKRSAFRNGWRMRALARPETGLVGVILDTAGFAPRFDLSVEKVPNGIEVMAVTQIERGLKGITLLLDTPRDGQLVELEMEYRPSSQSAVVRAGGQVVTDNYSGHLEYRQDVGPALFISIHREAQARGILGDTQFEILG